VGKEVHLDGCLKKMIHTNLYAVKQYQNIGKKDACVTVLVTYNSKAAWGEKRFRESDRLRSFPLMEIKVVHPSQSTVDAWIAAGNKI
jgi:hypothetical protein